jgi:ferredoxin-NADP reductase
MLEDLEPGVSADVIVRASTPEDLVLHDELRDLVGRRNGALHEMVGPRADVPLHADIVRRLIPDIAERSVFLCGPEGFVKSFITVARALGVTPHRIHHEQFAF